MTKTYRGGSVNELLGQIKADFGDDAVVLAQRETLMGGVGGFFQKPCVELDVASATELAAAGEQLEPFGAPAPAGSAPAPVPAVAEELGVAHNALLESIRAAQGIDVRDDDAPAFPGAAPSPFEALLSGAASPAIRPQVDARIPDLSEVLSAPRGSVASFIPDAVVAAGTVPAPPVGSMAAVLHGAAEGTIPSTAPVFGAPVVQGTVPTSAIAARHGGAIAETNAAWPAEAHAALDSLADAGIDSVLGTEIVTHALTDLAPFAASSDVRPLVVQALAARIPVTSLRGTAGRVVAFVGPGGSGKTRCIAGIASAYATRSNLSVACVTLRAKDGGAELQRALGPVGVPVHAARDIQQARDHVATLRTHSLVLIDTPGVSPRAEAEMMILARELEQVTPDEVHLTVPATTGATAARECIVGTALLGVTALALTHLDETSELGPSIGLAVESRLPLSFISRGATDTAALRPAVAHELAGALVHA